MQIVLGDNLLCLLRRQYAWNVKAYFWRKVRKIFLICCLLNLPHCQIWILADSILTLEVLCKIVAENFFFSYFQNRWFTWNDMPFFFSQKKKKRKKKIFRMLSAAVVIDALKLFIFYFSVIIMLDISSELLEMIQMKCKSCFHGK